MSSKKNQAITCKQQSNWESLMCLGKMCGCHQIQSRSFFYKNFQFPVCARCTGIFIGEFIVAPIFLVIGFNHLLLNLIFLSTMITDGVLQFFNILQSNNRRRLITGLMGGFALMSLTIFLITKVWQYFF